MRHCRFTRMERNPSHSPCRNSKWFAGGNPQVILVVGRIEQQQLVKRSPLDVVRQALRETLCYGVCGVIGAMELLALNRPRQDWFGRPSNLDIVVRSELPQDGCDLVLLGITGCDRHHQGIEFIIPVCYRDSVQVQKDEG